MLTSQEQERYARQIMMPELGEAGQETLKRSRVLVIGAGGLGSPAAYYLAAAGVGTIGIADGDTVELSNLQRQILHKESRLGQNKAVSAAKSLHGLNAQVHVQTYSQFMDGAHLRQVLPDYDIVIDATDQLENKFLINDVCVSAEKPFVHGGITGFSGQVMTYVPEKGPCYRCIFGEVPEDNAPAPIPVIGVTAGIIGTGKIGQAMAKICRGFGMKVIAYDLFPNKNLDFLEYVSLDELLSTSDLISLHCPMTPETEHLINSETIAKMKDGVILVNTSRGGLIKTDDLIAGIRDHKFFAVGLDVYEEESAYVYEDMSSSILPTSTIQRLLSFPNVTMTSHQGFFTVEALTNIAETTLENAKTFMDGAEMKNLVH